MVARRDVSALLPFDLTEILQTELEKERRPNDFLLHAASHLEGPLRHAQLEVAGAPKVEESFASGVPLWLGHLVHEDVHRMLRKAGVPYMAEVNMTPWLPQGWGGTADAFVYHPELKAFVLTDFKTTNVRAVKYLERDGAKVEHVKQTSAYWHAARKMGLPLAKKIGVYYIPKDHLTEPLMLDFDPLPVRELAKDMRSRYGAVSEYVKSLPKPNPRPLYPEEYINDQLAPGPEREQRCYFDKSNDTWEVKLVPPWYAAFCEFGELCTCHELSGTTKIGFYDFDGTYYPRTGFEHIKPTVAPSF